MRVVPGIRRAGGAEEGAVLNFTSNIVMARLPNPGTLAITVFSGAGEGT